MTAPAVAPSARCRCGHRFNQHYRDRKGRPMCVGSCGCQGYIPRGEATRLLADAYAIATGSLTVWLLGVALLGLAACRLLDLTRPLGVLLFAASIGGTR